MFSRVDLIRQCNNIMNTSIKPLHGVIAARWVFRHLHGKRTSSRVLALRQPLVGDVTAEAMVVTAVTYSCSASATYDFNK